MSAATGTARLIPHAKKLGELSAELRVIRADDAECLERYAPDLRDLLGLEQFTAYGVEQVGEQSQGLAFLYSAGVRSPSKRIFSEWMIKERTRWGAFDAGRPEAAQRNRPVAWTGEWLVEMGDRGALPLVRDRYAEIGIRGLDQLRVLVCNRSSLLAWVGGWQAGPVEQRQLDALASLVPDLQRRLRLERDLERGRRWSSFDATLEAIGRAAFVLDASGRIREANAAAKVRLAAEGESLRNELGDAIRRRSDHPKWSLTPIRQASSVEYLLVARTEHARASEQSACAAARWGLTARQRDVLRCVVEGNSNKTAAAILGIAERTVEFHVTALLEAAQVEGRSELVAKVWMME